MEILKMSAWPRFSKRYHFIKQLFFNSCGRELEAVTWHTGWIKLMKSASFVWTVFVSYGEITSQRGCFVSWKLFSDVAKIPRRVSRKLIWDLLRWTGWVWVTHFQQTLIYKIRLGSLLPGPLIFPSRLLWRGEHSWLRKDIWPVVLRFCCESSKCDSNVPL